MHPDDKKSLLDRVFAATSPTDERASAYHTDMKVPEFTGPHLVAEAVVRGLKLNHISSTPLDGVSVLDAGCGKGTAGVELAKLGAKGVVGLDNSEGMLEKARATGVYSEAKVADLTKRLEWGDGVFDAATSCGVFTDGHFGPEPLNELVRVVKVGGVVAVAIQDSHWVEANLDGVIDILRKDGKAELAEKTLHNYRKDSGGGWVVVLRKMKE